MTIRIRQQIVFLLLTWLRFRGTISVSKIQENRVRQGYDEEGTGTEKFMNQTMESYDNHIHDRSVGALKNVQQLGGTSCQLMKSNTMFRNDTIVYKTKILILQRVVYV